MANETTFTTMTSGFTLSAAIANEHILEALYDLNHVDRLTRRVDLSGKPTKSHDIGLWPRLGAASVSEGVDASTTQVTSTKTTVTAGESVIMVTPTDALNLSSLAATQDFAMACAEAIREKQMSDVANLATGFSTSVGTTTVNLTEANWMDAVATLANNRHMGNLAALLYPQQYFDLAAGIGGTFTPASSTGASARQEANAWAFAANGVQDPYFGIPIYLSTAVPTANAGADSAGMMVHVPRAIARGVKYDSRVEFQRDASLRATEVIVTSFDGVAEIEDAAGVGIVTDR